MPRFDGLELISGRSSKQMYFWFEEGSNPKFTDLLQNLMLPEHLDHLFPKSFGQKMKDTQLFTLKNFLYTPAAYLWLKDRLNWWAHTFLCGDWSSHFLQLDYVHAHIFAIIYTVKKIALSFLLSFFLLVFWGHFVELYHYPALAALYRYIGQ